jgi:hypothetical protein
MKNATLQKPLPWVPLTVAAARADPGRPIIPPATAIVIVPSALAFRNDRRFKAVVAGIAKPRLP